MAVVKWTALVTGMKGKLRGSVLQFGAAGQVMRANRQFNSFSNVLWNQSKNNLGNVTQNWRLLTPAQRNAWSAQTLNYPTTDRYGNTHYPSPYTLHMRLNLAMLYHTGTMLTTPLAPAAYSNITPLGLVISGTPTITATIGASTTTDELVLIFATPPLSNGRRAPKGLYRLMAAVDMSAITSYDFTTEYTKSYGQITPLMQIFCKAEVFNKTTGQISPPLIANAYS